jgi:hypothetical protein
MLPFCSISCKGFELFRNNQAWLKVPLKWVFKSKEWAALPTFSLAQFVNKRVSWVSYHLLFEWRTLSIGIDSSWCNTECRTFWNVIGLLYLVSYPAILFHKFDVGNAYGSSPVSSDFDSRWSRSHSQNSSFFLSEESARNKVMNLNGWICRLSGDTELITFYLIHKRGRWF